MGLEGSFWHALSQFVSVTMQSVFPSINPSPRALMRYICILSESIAALVTKLSCNPSDALNSMRLTFPLRACQTCPFLIETLSTGSNRRIHLIKYWIFEILALDSNSSTSKLYTKWVFLNSKILRRNSHLQWTRKFLLE